MRGFGVLGVPKFKKIKKVKNGTEEIPSVVPVIQKVPKFIE